MTRRKKDNDQLKKLPDFFQMKDRGLLQDGAGAMRDPPSPTGSARSAFSSPGSQAGSKHSSPGASTPMSRSPAKSKPRLTEDTQQGSMTPDTMEDTRELVDPFTAFPTTGKPVSDTTLKDMLVSLRSSMHTDMMQCVHNFKSELGAIGGRVDHIEDKMGDFAASHNTLIDAHNDQSDEITWLRSKVADLEDRSRRNNIKIRGVPENVLPPQLQQYAQDLIQTFLPNIPDNEIYIDRIHRLPKPAHLPDNIPRDVLMRVHFYQTKEQLMSAFRKNQQPPERFAHLQLFADLSQFTMQKRKALLPVTKALRNHDIPYRWGYPVKLTVTHDGNTTVITDVEEGLKLLRSLDILPVRPSEGPSPPAKLDTQYEWQTVSRKSSTKRNNSKTPKYKT